MEPFFVVYLATWLTACLIAIALVLRRPADFAIAQPIYWRYLAQPWKLGTFAVAAAGITVIAPYTGDPTWDYGDALMMSVLTFTSAPWAVGTLVRLPRRQASLPQAYVALCALLLSASWSYDLYLLVRDGDYPMTWWANLAASSILYLLAGMLWSLEWRSGRGATFGFLESGWPDPEHAGGCTKLAVYALPIMVLVIALIAPFLWDGWR